MSGMSKAEIEKKKAEYVGKFGGFSVIFINLSGYC